MESCSHVNMIDAAHSSDKVNLISKDFGEPLLQQFAADAPSKPALSNGMHSDFLLEIGTRIEESWRGLV